MAVDRSSVRWSSWSSRVRISAVVLSTSTPSLPIVLVLRPFVSSLATIALSLGLASCRQTPISRNGPPQQTVVSRTYSRPLRELRAAILDAYPKPDVTRPEMFRILSISEQPPPGFSADWLGGYVDPGGFFEPYRRLTPAEQSNDLVLREATEDRYWPSEYEANGRAVKFRCALIIHFIAREPGTTEVQVFELVPTVWVGEHWAMSREGPGFGKYHDIRFVEPTVKDRVAVLDFIEREAGSGERSRHPEEGGAKRSPTEGSLSRQGLCCVRNLNYEKPWMDSDPSVASLLQDDPRPLPASRQPLTANRIDLEPRRSPAERPRDLHRALDEHFLNTRPAMRPLVGDGHEHITTNVAHDETSLTEEPRQ